jgi:integrase
MSLIFRCTKKDCRVYYALVHKKCPKCSGKSRNYYVSYRVEGKLKFKFAGETLSTAKETEARITLALSDKDGNGKITKRYTLADFVKEVFLPYFIAKNNRREMKNNEQHVLNVTSGLPNKWLDEITPMDIEQLLSSLLRRGRSIATRNNYLALLRGMFNFAVRMEYLKTSPVKSKKIPVDNARVRYLTQEETKRLLEECKKSNSPNLYACVLVALKTGMRAGEIRQLKKEHVRDGHIYLTGDMTKQKKSKAIPIVKSLAEYLDTLPEFNVTHDCKKAFIQAVKRAGIENFHFHDLRHTFASNLIMKGVSDYIVADLLGHTSTKMVRRYAHLSPESRLKAIMKLEDDEEGDD